MHDPNLIDFYNRVGRLQKAHAAGQGFEAVGTLGRSHYTRRQRGRRSAGLILPLFFVLLAVFGLKATIHYHVGDQTYQGRLVAMREGEGFDRLGAALMQADPVTLWLSAKLRQHLDGGSWGGLPQG